MPRETDIDSLEVRNYKSLKWKTLIVLVLFVASAISIVVQISSKFFWVHFKPVYIYWFVVLGFLVVGIIYYIKQLYYDKEIQLKIDKDGIWTPKYKVWQWNDIWYFSTSEERNGNDIINFLEIKLGDGVNDDKNSLVLPLDNYDKSKEEIRDIIGKYALLNNVQDLGNDDTNRT